MQEREYKPALLNRHPALALLGWFPPVYLVGIIRNWGKPWCNNQRGWIPNPFGKLDAFVWPNKLYERKKLQGVPIWWKREHSR